MKRSEKVFAAALLLILPAALAGPWGIFLAMVSMGLAIVSGLLANEGL